MAYFFITLPSNFPVHKKSNPRTLRGSHNLLNSTREERVWPTFMEMSQNFSSW